MKIRAKLKREDGTEKPCPFMSEEKNGVTLVRTALRGDEPLDLEAGVRYLLDPCEAVRWMADWRYSEFWCCPAFGTDLQAVPRDTQLFLYEKTSGGWGAVVPVTAEDYKCVLEGTGEGLTAVQFSWKNGVTECGDLAFAAAEGDDPYELVSRCVSAAAEVLHTVLRKDRRYPEVFEYLGWCSWDALQIRVSESGVLEKCREFCEKNIPVKWMIFDDMWAEIAKFDREKYTNRQEMFRLMHSSPMTDFEASRTRFPEGLAHAISEVNEYGIKVGIWHPSTGYWYGLDPEGEALKKLSEWTITEVGGRIISDWHTANAYRFFDTMHRFFRESGAAFLKVDNQSMTRRYYKGLDTVGRVTREWHRGLEASVGLNFDSTMINCMGMASEDMWNRGFSSVSRCSDDFQPENRPWFTKHILQCTYNSVLQGQFFWNDYDMWWTDDTQAEKNSVLRAVSGGPIYVSDEIGRSRPEILKPLCFDDGRILRCDRSGMPTADCLVEDPETSGKPLKIQNMTGDSGVIAAFNVTKEQQPVEGVVRPSDVPGLNGESFVVYEYFTKTVRVISADEEVRFTLRDIDDYRLFSIIPYADGFAPIGRLDKFLSHAAITSQIGGAVKLYEPGPYGYVRDKMFIREECHA
jgi:hypothetical protein